ncbi:MAG: SUMF1/EgtB/PvdO family nonheme iron enzyme [Thermodesulfobacteriota bacterium]
MNVRITPYFFVPAFMLILIIYSPGIKYSIASEINTKKTVENEHFKRGRYYLHEGEYHAAVDTLLLALKEDPGNWGALRAIGFAYFRMGKKEKALEYWNEALKGHPDDFVLQSLVKYIEQGSEGITHPPDPSDSTKKMPPIKLQSYLEGEKFFRERNYDMAIEKFQEAVKKADSDFRIYFALGAAYREIERLDDAILSWEKALRFSPDNVLITKMLTIITMKFMLKEEIEDLKEKIREKPLDWESRLMLAEKYLDFNNNLTTHGSQADKYIKKAIKELQDVIKLRPDHIVSFQRLVDLSLKMGMFGDAVGYQKSLVKLKPNNEILTKELKNMRSFQTIIDRSMKSIKRGGKEINLDEEMVFIPEGEFLMGAKDTLLEIRKDETPEHKIFLKGFYIDKYEVTRVQFKKFVKSTSYSTVGFSPILFLPQWDYFPVSGITYGEATDYCRFAGKRLPTEEEWEKAARGTDGRRYPWGSTLEKERINTRVSAFNRPAPIGGLPEGKSPYGAFEMSGNLQEWTDSWYKRYPGNRSSSLRNEDYGEKFRVIRGGAFLLDPLRSMVTSRNYGHPDFRGLDVGFRCAKNG